MERTGNKGFYVGIVFIAIGAILILKRLNIIPWSLSDILISWQMLLIAFGAMSLSKGNRVMGIILIGVGTFFILPEIINVPQEIRRIYWPAMLLLIGVALVYRQRGPVNPVNRSTDGKTFDEFDDFVIFGGREIFINAEGLRGGRSTSVFGGIEYDFRQATLSTQGAVIDCTCIFGGTGLKVPLDWNVRNEVTTIFGAFTDRRGDSFREGQLDPSKTVVIKGITLFGGVEIKHV